MKKLIRVKDLTTYIETNKIPDNAVISLEGCDCVGLCRGVSHEPLDNGWYDMETETAEPNGTICLDLLR